MPNVPTPLLAFHRRQQQLSSGNELAGVGCPPPCPAMTALLARVALLALMLAQGQQLIAAAEQLLPPRFASDPPPTKSLFVDNALFANLSGDIGLVRHRPTPTGTVLVPDKPWETFGFIGYHTVVQAGPTEYRMYYVRACSVASLRACTGTRVRARRPAFLPVAQPQRVALLAGHRVGHPRQEGFSSIHVPGHLH